jgi:hypothetical protein
MKTLITNLLLMATIFSSSLFAGMVYEGVFLPGKGEGTGLPSLNANTSNGGLSFDSNCFGHGTSFLPDGHPLGITRLAGVD